MKPKSSYVKSSTKAPAGAVAQDIRRRPRRHFSAGDKIRIVLEGLRGGDSIAELCRAIFSRRIPPPQPITIDEDDAAQNPPVIDALPAMFGK